MLAAAVLAAALVGSCSLGDSGEDDETQPESTVGPAELANSSLAGAAYELEVLNLGGVLRRAVIEPPPVGATSIVEVQINGINADGTLGAVGARMEMAVLRSRADGSTLSADFTLTEVDAADPTLATALQLGLGSSLAVERDAVAMVSDYSLELAEADNLDPTTAFWLTRLLEAPTAFVGPIPEVPLGEDARWRVVLASSDGTELVETRELIGLDSDRFTINGSTNGGSDEQTVVLEGQIGDPIPHRQVVTIGRLTTTVTVVS